MLRFLGWMLIIIAFFVGLAWWRWHSPPAVNETPRASLLSLIQLTPTPTPPIKLLFGGDLMFDRHIRQFMAVNGVEFPLAPLAETFAQYDAVIGNLEGPVTDFPSRSVNSEVGSTNNFIFTFEPTIVPMLKQQKFIVNLGNNHILNFGVNGVAKTKQYLTEGNVEFFGNTSTETNPNQRILLKDFDELTLAFVNYNQFVDNGLTTALEDVVYAEPLADLVIVMPHWGNEYRATANAIVQDWAHQLIDKGADLVIGGHAHVIQQSEDYRGKMIYYSLGNFVFDQYFEPAVQKGLLVGVEIKPDKSLTLTEIPIQLDRSGQTKLEN